MVTQEHWERGLTLLLTGLIRKVAIADPAGVLVDAYFASPSSFTSIPLACGLLLYGLQIYNDFAGYSEMARGSANLMGFDLMRNFRHPYFARNISEFWTRVAHLAVDLATRLPVHPPWRQPERTDARTYVNLMITMLLGGLWHGASWNFVIWGALHGLALAFTRMWQRARPERRGGLPRRPHARDPRDVPLRLPGVGLFPGAHLAHARLALGRIAQGTLGAANLPSRVLIVLSLAAALHFLPRRLIDEVRSWSVTKPS